MLIPTTEDDIAADENEVPPNKKKGEKDKKFIFNHGSLCIVNSLCLMLTASSVCLYRHISILVITSLFFFAKFSINTLVKQVFHGLTLMFVAPESTIRVQTLNI